ncbi:MAG: 2-hydroxychromene-2-carboxylate isomerase [Alphaproteobacteria bacterium]|nr:2-hydroxychromene-2-carboxylate isomerase [Alphaproteobacteria bacterium]
MATLEYFYSAHSGYAYLGSACFMSIAEAANCTIIHKPMDLRRVVAVTGPGPTNGMTPGRRAYFSGREIARWAEMRDAPVMDGIPSFHDNDIALSNCMLIAGILQGLNIDLLAHHLLQAHWRDDADLADASTLHRLGEEAGYVPESLLEAATTEEVRSVYEQNTQEAIERSVFGSPTYFVDGDMFYGQDHLEMVARAIVQPFKGNWP